MSTPFNPVAHDAIIAAGYDYLHVTAEYWECGDAESGPRVDGHAAFDQYSKVLRHEELCDIIEFVYIDATDSGVEVMPDYPQTDEEL